MSSLNRLSSVYQHPDRLAAIWVGRYTFEMEMSQVREMFTPAVEEVLDFCRITDDFVDSELFRIYIATIWGNAVLEPSKCGLQDDELCLLHDFLNEYLEQVLGAGFDVRGCYEFIVSKEGEDSMARLEVSARHKEFLHYFARLILAEESR
ncbi:MAG: hypothetical protein HUJ31_01390 [Pseudomonadales bacterium]|nr:hypothetical protein [Pseudomonadales bacterium]